MRWQIAQSKRFTYESIRFLRVESEGPASQQGLCGEGGFSEALNLRLAAKGQCSSRRRVVGCANNALEDGGCQSMYDIRELSYALPEGVQRKPKRNQMVKRAKSAKAKKSITSTWDFLVDEPQHNGLSRERIVTIGIGIADSEGLDAVSIRKLASRLNVSAMALYHYVPSKTDLLNLMLDRTYEKTTFEDQIDPNWREILSLFSWQNKRRFESHTWVLNLPSAGRQYGPEAIRTLEWYLDKLALLGLETGFSVRILGLLYNFVIGFVSTEGETGRGGSSTGTPIFSPPVLATGRFPHVKRFAELGVEPPTDAAFARALDWLLDGVADEMPETSRKTKKRKG